MIYSVNVKQSFHACNAMQAKYATNTGKYVANARNAKK